MNRSPFPFRDFVRAKDNLVHALVETGETGTGKTALLRELRGHLVRTRHRVIYFSADKKRGARQVRSSSGLTDTYPAAWEEDSRSVKSPGVAVDDSCPRSALGLRANPGPLTNQMVAQLPTAQAAGPRVISIRAPSATIAAPSIAALRAPISCR